VGGHDDRGRRARPSSGRQSEIPTIAAQRGRDRVAAGRAKRPRPQDGQLAGQDAVHGGLDRAPGPVTGSAGQPHEQGDKHQHGDDAGVSRRCPGTPARPSA
jgi:hypothetical protein